MAALGTVYFDSVSGGHTSAGSAALSMWLAGGLAALCVPLGFLLPRFPDASGPRTDPAAR